MADIQYVCKAKAVDVVVGADGNGEGGTLQRVHQGGGLPLSGLYAKQIERLLDQDMIAKADIVGGLESAVVDAALTAGEPKADGEDGDTHRTRARSRS